MVIGTHRFVFCLFYQKDLGAAMLLSLCLLCLHRLFDSSEEQVEEKEEENQEDVSPQPASQSYAATVALPSTPPSSTTLMGTVFLNIHLKKPLQDSTLACLTGYLNYSLNPTVHYIIYMCYVLTTASTVVRQILKPAFVIATSCHLRLDCRFRGWKLTTMLKKCLHSHLIEDY